MSDKKTVSRILCGEKKYLEQVIGENYGEIYRYCYFHVHDRMAAEDLTQDIFLKFMQNLHTYAEWGKVKNYLYVTAANAVRDYFRREGRRSCESLEAAGEPAARREETEERLAVLAALEKLDEAQREIVILRYYQQLRFREIAQILSMPVSTVRHRLKQAEKILREELAQ